MADVIGHGPDGPSRRRRWVRPVGAVVVVAAVATGVAHRDVTDLLRASPSGPEAPPTPAATSPSHRVSGPAPDVRPWPTAGAACGSTASLPLLSASWLRRATTGIKVLVGGDGLRLVDVDTGAVRRLTEPPQARGGPVTELVAAPEGAAALRVRCDTLSTSAAGTVLSVDVARRTVGAPLRRRVDALLPGPDATWAFSYRQDSTVKPVELRPVDGGPSVTLPSGFDPAEVTRRDFIGNVRRDGQQFSDEGYPIAAVSRDDPADIRPLGGRGYVAAATDRFVLTQTTCEARTDCLLTRIGVDGALRRYPLPTGRTPTSEFVLSADGRYAAFQLSRPEPDPRYATGHPGGPSDLAVQDLVTGVLTVVPGVELAPKTSAGLAFGPDGRWLVIALNEGRRARLLVWRHGMNRPMQSPARLPGRVLYDVPILDVTRVAANAFQ